VLAVLKETALGIVTALCLYAIFGGYIAAMFNGKLPIQQSEKQVSMCAVFQDGTTYGRDSTISIDAYHERTKQSFDYQECNQ